MTDPSPSQPVEPQLEANNSGMSTTAMLEALLFAAPGPVTPVQLAATLDAGAQEIEKELAELEKLLYSRGIRLQRHAGKVQLVTAPEAAAAVEKLVGLEASSRLSRAALEALAIIAYQQPVTRPEIDAVRGVNSDGVLKSLLSKGLVQEMGRSTRPGRPILYSTTSDFLSHFGLPSLEALPPLATVNSNNLPAEEPEQENGLLKD